MGSFVILRAMRSVTYGQCAPTIIVKQFIRRELEPLMTLGIEWGYDD